MTTISPIRFLGNIYFGSQTSIDKKMHNPTFGSPEFDHQKIALGWLYEALLNLKDPINACISNENIEKFVSNTNKARLGMNFYMNGLSLDGSQGIAEDEKINAVIAVLNNIDRRDLPVKPKSYTDNLSGLPNKAQSINNVCKAVARKLDYVPQKDWSKLMDSILKARDTSDTSGANAVCEILAVKTRFRVHEPNSSFNEFDSFKKILNGVIQTDPERAFRANEALKPSIVTFSTKRQQNAAQKLYDQK